MRARQTKLLILVSGFFLIVFGFKYSLDYARQKAIAENLAMKEVNVSRLFQRIQPAGKQALLTPAPVNRAITYPNELYILSESENDTWKKPKKAGISFKFGFFNGAKHSQYRILKVQPDGVLLEYSYSGEPPGKHDTFVLHWK